MDDSEGKQKIWQNHRSDHGKSSVNELLAADSPWSKSDELLLEYADTHCRTEVAMLSADDLRRIWAMAGERYPFDPQRKVAQVGPEVMLPLIARARERMTRPTNEPASPWTKEKLQAWGDRDGEISTAAGAMFAVIAENRDMPVAIGHTLLALEENFIHWFRTTIEIDAPRGTALQRLQTPEYTVVRAVVAIGFHNERGSSLEADPRWVLRAERKATLERVMTDVDRRIEAARARYKVNGKQSEMGCELGLVHLRRWLEDAIAEG